MTAMEMAFRSASKNNTALAGIVDSAARNIAAEKAKSEAEAVARCKAEEEAFAEAARKQRREELKAQIEKQNFWCFLVSAILQWITLWHAASSGPKIWKKQNFSSAISLTLCL